MGFTDVIQLGNRIDIKPLGKGGILTDAGRITETCQSSVTERLSDTELAILMPMLEGKMILFPMGAECDLVFFTHYGMYRCTGVVKGRAKDGNLYLLSLLLKTAPQKYQRREYFRISYLSELKYYEIPESVAQIGTTDRILEELRRLGAKCTPASGMIQDISGGGLRFLAEKEYERDAFLFLLVKLENGQMNADLYLVGQIMGSSEHPSRPGMYNNRAKFLYKDLRDREKIVRFVFEEERRLRKKEMGE